ncbi:MAG: hypothetical protein HZA81_03085 [Candidatus Taylorbacteria bacterium]|nr:hypothetical protein [Candidatus Taylorbacteria bacterium]
MYTSPIPPLRDCIAPGTSLQKGARQAVSTAHECGHVVRVLFAGAALEASPHSDPKAVMRRYRKACRKNGRKPRTRHAA